MSESIRARREALADALLDDLERLRGQLFSPSVEHKALVVSDGKDAGSHVEKVEIELAEPTFAAKRLIVASIAQGIDKVLELVGQGAQPDADDDDEGGWGSLAAVAGIAEVRDAKKSEPGNSRPRGRRGGKTAG